MWSILGLIPAGAGNIGAMWLRSTRIGAHPRRCGEHALFSATTTSGQGSSPQVRGTSKPLPHRAVFPWAHPRRCGEHPRVLPLHQHRFGSSPQVRGTSLRVTSPHLRLRLIPAGAGNMAVAWARRRPSWAHPRRCGEHLRMPTNVLPEPGSSPQVRGTFTDPRQQRLQLGLIPAGAGNIGRPAPTWTRRRAHPRRCGEHDGLTVYLPTTQGSSPQVRGTFSVWWVMLGPGWAHPRRCGEHAVRRYLDALPPGSSPQVRGTFSGHHLVEHGVGAHPRRCGEHYPAHMRVTQSGGSSPQVRGTLRMSTAGPGTLWLIPAGAGNMPRRPARTPAARAHPRRCGEHHVRPRAVVSLPGSSPQVRGTSRRRRQASDTGGLIPAGAGNMPPVTTTFTPSTAHPRRCGEHAARDDHVHALNGSSPQVRGTSGPRSSRQRHQRLIPAGAGNIRERDIVGTNIPGSSPQVRGTLRGSGSTGETLGLIPAGAGNISNSVAPRSVTTAHPRRCGEHDGEPVALNEIPGSSPQVRGTSPLRSLALRAHGLIPAGAGNISGRRVPPDAYPGSSPQVRGTSTRPGRTSRAPGLIPAGAGNMSISTSSSSSRSGSSPQVRGTCRTRCRRRGRRRLIPAGAGNMRRERDGHGVGGAHPRRCGEHRGQGAGQEGQQGSSPQVRGTCPPNVIAAAPAWAHPRRCGEHPVGPYVDCGGGGSSPQVRGTLRCDLGHLERVGLIPAGAGNIAYLRDGRSSPEAHPRRCGEHDSRFMPAFESGHPGLIPAGAGNIDRPPVAHGNGDQWAHPRRCGEHWSMHRPS